MTEILTDMNACAARMVELLQSATHSLYYSSFVCQLDAPLPGQPRHLTMSHLLHQAVGRGVKVYMFFNPSEQYGNSMAEVEQLRSAGVHVAMVTSDGYIPAPFDAVFGERYTNHHQKFLVADQATIMIGGVGVHPCRAGWMVLNTEPEPYYWHEVGVVAPCTAAMATYITDMWEGSYTLHPPFPLVAAEEEHSFTLRMIREAVTCIHMEAQLCISTPSTHNRVLDTVVERVATAFATPGDTFCFMLVVNTHQPDEHPVVSGATTATLHWSRRMMMAGARARGVPEAFMRERVFMGTLEKAGTHIKVHSNLIIQDGHTMLRSSSNLTDRSLSPTPCDNELGIVVTGPEVARAQQLLWARYFEMPGGGPWWPRTAFRLMQNETGVLTSVRYHNLHDTTFVPDGVVDFFMRHLHELPYFGGKKKVEWATQLVQ
jgi:phosphatidylserine/phosphatidylglycerophosphate/cardiolipin synthase-like enzyme